MEFLIMNNARIRISEITSITRNRQLREPYYDYLYEISTKNMEKFRFGFYSHAETVNIDAKTIKDFYEGMK